MLVELLWRAQTGVGPGGFASGLSCPGTRLAPRLLVPCLVASGVLGPDGLRGPASTSDGRGGTRLRFQYQLSKGAHSNEVVRMRCCVSPKSQHCEKERYFTGFDRLASVGQTKVSQFSSVAQSCPTLCDPMNRSTPVVPVHHQLPEFTQTHVHPVSDAFQPSHPLSSPSPPAPNPSQHQSLFQ